jgi:hypothetical protein
MNERYANGYVQSLTVLIYLISLQRLMEKGTSGKMLFLMTVQCELDMN